MAGPGGSRPGAGRPPGSRNKVPSRALQAQQQFAELVLPELESYFLVLDGIAKNPGNRPSDRIAAITVLLDRAMGKPKESVEVTTPDDGATAEDLLNTWREAQP